MSDQDALCPACGAGQTVRNIEVQPFEYRGVTLHAEDICMVCETCGTEIATPEDMRLSTRAQQRARKTYDGVLTGDEIRRFRDSFGLSQEVAAKLFGGGKVAFSKYENDDVIQSTAMESLLRLCIDAPENIARLAEIKKVTLPDVTIRTIFNHKLEVAFSAVPWLQDWLAETAIDKPAVHDEDCSNDELFECAMHQMTVDVDCWSEAVA